MLRHHVFDEREYIIKTEVVIKLLSHMLPCLLFPALCFDLESKQCCRMYPLQEYFHFARGLNVIFLEFVVLGPSLVHSSTSWKSKWFILLLSSKV